MGKKMVFMSPSEQAFRMVKEFEKKYGFQENSIANIVQNPMFMTVNEFYNSVDVIKEQVEEKADNLSADWIRINKLINDLVIYVDK